MVDFFHNEGLVLTFTSVQRYDIYGDGYHMKVFGRGGGRCCAAMDLLCHMIFLDCHPGAQRRIWSKAKRCAPTYAHPRTTTRSFTVLFIACARKACARDDNFVLFHDGAGAKPSLKNRTTG